MIRIVLHGEAGQQRAQHQACEPIGVTSLPDGPNRSSAHEAAMRPTAIRALA